MDSEYITTGYRPRCDDVRAALLSMVNGKLHNETLNAWTMVIGTLIIAGLSAQPSSTILQKLMGGVLLIYIPFPFLYHTLSCSPKHAPQMRLLDVSGIMLVSCFLAFALALAITGSWIFAGALAILGVLNFLVALKYINNVSKEGFVNNDDRKKTMMAIGTAVLIYNTPILWALISYTYPVNSIQFWLCVSEVIAISIAAAFYATGFPESKYPGTFDLIGSSHQLAHVFIIIQQLCIWFLLG